MRTQCTLRQKNNKYFITTKVKKVRYNDKVWAFNSLAYKEADGCGCELIEAFYEIGEVMMTWCDVDRNREAHVLANVVFNPKQTALHMKVSAMELVLFEDHQVDQLLKQPEKQMILANGGTCYINLGEHPIKRVYLDPDIEFEFPGETAVLEKKIVEYQMQEKSDEAIHSQYDPEEEELADQQIKNMV